MRIWPVSTAIMLSPGDPIKNMVSPAAKWRSRARATTAV